MTSVLVAQILAQGETFRRERLSATAPTYRRTRTHLLIHYPTYRINNTPVQYTALQYTICYSSGTYILKSSPRLTQQRPPSNYCVRRTL